MIQTGPIHPALMMSQTEAVVEEVVGVHTAVIVRIQLEGGAVGQLVHAHAPPHLEDIDQQHLLYNLS